MESVNNVKAPARKSANVLKAQPGKMVKGKVCRKKKKTEKRKPARGKEKPQIIQKAGNQWINQTWREKPGVAALQSRRKKRHKVPRGGVMHPLLTGWERPKKEINQKKGILENECE